MITEPTRIRDSREAQREASSWIVRLDADDVSEQDRQQFEAWKAAHPQNARAYAAVLATWHRVLKSGPLVRAVAFGTAMDRAATVPRSARRWVVGAVAATLAGAAVLMSAYWWQSRSETVFQTAIGESASVSLPDGSSLELNSNSRIRVEFDTHRRLIRLQRGEAFFRVSHDPQRAFWVVAGDSWVRAVGTAFNVYLRPRDVEVTVSEGTVKVTSQRSADEVPSDEALGTGPVSILKAGEQADLASRAALIRALDSGELRRSIAWRQGSLYFEDRPLAEVVREMGRYTSLQLEIEDPVLGRMPIGGRFQATPEGAEALLTLLQEGLGLRVRHEGRDRVVIARGPESP